MWRAGSCLGIIFHRFSVRLKICLKSALPNDNYFAYLADKACNLVQSERNESQIIGRQLDQKTVANLVDLVQYAIVSISSWLSLDNLAGVENCGQLQTSLITWMF